MTTSEDFWDFSVRTYRTTGVPDACLSLQNDHGTDVNMLLYCCWVGGFMGRFENKSFDNAFRFSREWADNVVIRLRSARTWMKHTGCQYESVPTESCMALREEIKTAEFACEKMQQEVLESLVTTGTTRHNAESPKPADIVANLFRYLTHAGIEDAEDVRLNLLTIILAAFPTIDPESIKAALDSGTVDARPAPDQT